jgi:high-affinity nickel permease
MFGLDERVAGLSNGTTLALVVLVSMVLGVRHASDPDHVAAVTTLVAGERERVTRSAARLGLSWGLGHAASLFVFGLPVILYSAYLPESVQKAAETSVGIVIIGLAIGLLLRCRRGFHVHARVRSERRAFAIGLLHGVGGTAGVGILLLASIHSHALALVALALFASCTAASMALLSLGFGVTFSRPRMQRVFKRAAPGIGVISAVFGVWYALGAQGIVPYVF